MPLDNVVSNVSYYGSFAWVYGIEKDLWDAATRSYTKNFDQIKKPHLITLIDYRIAKRKPRLWVLNFFAPSPQLVTWTWCAHGKGSGKGECRTVGKDNRQSCTGGFITGGTWKSHLGQKDKTGKKVKHAMALYGLDPTNDNAHRRGIRWHGAHYVKPNSVANSWGCICPPQKVHDKLVDTLAHGSFVFSYFGEDSVEV